MNKDLKNILLEAMKQRGVKIPKLSKETGIPKDRIYKWYQEGTSPKPEDALILEKWIKTHADEDHLQGIEIKAMPTNFDKNQFVELLQRQLELMQKNNETLLRILDEKISNQEVSLAKIEKDQKALLTLVTDAIIRAAHYRYDGNKKALDNELAEINNIVGAALK